jgi:uncharacterized protein (DUF433 family)
MRQINDAILNRITFDPNILRGKPTIRGLRIGVEHILEMLAAGVSQAELLDEYPDLESDDIHAVMLYAAMLVADERVIPLAA